MTQQQDKTVAFFDAEYTVAEQLPRKFSVSFQEINNTGEVRVILNNSKQIGDVINDNSYQADFYRYHDIFHYTFASMLGWSPCTRSMMKCKRKSSPIIDEIEDGARATITEEALSLLIFNEAKKNNFFSNGETISRNVLELIKEMTEPFEVKIRSYKDWEEAIIKAYEVFRLLIANKGGTIEFDSINRKLKYTISN
jgi:hypothetical protein